MTRPSRRRLYSVFIFYIVLASVLSPLIREARAQVPRIYVDPPSVAGLLPGDPFTISLFIEDAVDVYSWECKLSFAPFIEVLNITEVLEGDFLMMGGVTYFSYDLDNYAGSLRVGATLLNPVPGVSGPGILVFVTFQVVGGGESPIDLHDTILEDSSGNPIAHTAEDGYFTGMAPYAYFTYRPSPMYDGYDPSINQTVTFNATDSYDPDGGSIVSYQWDLGDGTIETVAAPILQHNYTTAMSNILVNLTVLDDTGYSDTYTNPNVNVVIRDITIANVEVSPTGQVKAGTSIDIDVRAENIGTGTESFNVTAYYDDEVIEMQQVINLNPIPPSPPWRHVVNLTFTWNTAGVSTGEYTIKVVAHTYPGEMNSTNNEVIWGTIIIAQTSAVIYKTTVYGVTFRVGVETDSETISGFAFNYTLRKVIFTVGGLEGLESYSNVSIPMAMLNVSDSSAWVVTLNGTTTEFTATNNGTHYFVRLNYTFASAYTINVVGTKVPIPPQPALSMVAKALVGEQVTLNGTASTDPDGHGIQNYFWEVYTLSPFDEKVPVWNKTTTSPTVAVVFNESAYGPSALKVVLTVTNNMGFKNSTAVRNLEVLWPFDIGIVDVVTSTSVANIGQSLLINVTVTSKLNTHGDVIKFTVKIFGNDTLLTTKLVPSTTLPEITAPLVGQNKTVSLSWNTTGVAPGTYKLNASITVVRYATFATFPAEPNVEDNTFVYGDVRVKKWDISVGIVVSPSSITVGETIKITGTLSPILESVSVTIQYRLGDLRTWLNASTVVTNALGQYSYDWTPEIAATYEVRTTWPGDAINSANVSATRTVAVGRIFSQISIEASSTSVSAGSSVSLTGKITPATSGVTVTIKVRRNGGEWITLTTVTTDAQGNYVYDWQVTEAGTYEIQTSWQGNVNTAGSESQISTVQVHATTLPEVYIYGAVAAIVIIAVLVGAYFLRKRKP